MKLYKFELLFFDGTVLTGKFCVGVPLNILSIYLNIEHLYTPSSDLYKMLVTCIRKELWNYIKKKLMAKLLQQHR